MILDAMGYEALAAVVLRVVFLAVDFLGVDLLGVDFLEAGRFGHETTLTPKALVTLLNASSALVRTGSV